MNPEDIEWTEMWREKQKILSPESDTDSQEERWDKIASFYKLWSEHDEYPTKLLQRIQMQREWSVLDIGCGTGVIAIAAAMRANRVTALDVSARMLEILKNEADRRYLGNIQYLHRTWESIRIGTDIKPHDVVITSRAIARTGDLEKSLKKIDEAATRYAYVTAWGGEQGEFTREFREALGHEYKDTPDDIYVYNILRQMGIHPNVEQIECSNTIRYENYNQALSSYKVLFNLTQKEEDIALGFIMKHLNRRKDGRYELPETRIIWSLIWWKKPGVRETAH